jgi:hypothetical protein
MNSDGKSCDRSQFTFRNCATRTDKQSKEGGQQVSARLHLKFLTSGSWEEAARASLEVAAATARSRRSRRREGFHLDRALNIDLFGITYSM